MRITRSTRARRIFRDPHRCTYLLPFYVTPLGRVRRVPRRMRTYKEQGPRHSLIQSHATTNGCARRFVRSFNRLDKRTNEWTTTNPLIKFPPSLARNHGKPRQTTLLKRICEHERPNITALLVRGFPPPPFLLCHFLGSSNIGRLVPLTGGRGVPAHSGFILHSRLLAVVVTRKGNCSSHPLDWFVDYSFFIFLVVVSCAGSPTHQRMQTNHEQTYLNPWTRERWMSTSLFCTFFFSTPLACSTLSRNTGFQKLERKWLRYKPIHTHKHTRTAVSRETSDPDGEKASIVRYYFRLLSIPSCFGVEAGRCTERWRGVTASRPKQWWNTVRHYGTDALVDTAPAHVTAKVGRKGVRAGVGRSCKPPVPGGVRSKHEAFIYAVP